jgi:hypothetical protein
VNQGWTHRFQSPQNIMFIPGSRRQDPYRPRVFLMVIKRPKMNNYTNVDKSTFRAMSSFGITLYFCIKRIYCLFELLEDLENLCQIDSKRE